MKLLKKLLEVSELHAKWETLRLLRCMSERQLHDCGISPELLREGIKAWPWKTQENTDFQSGHSLAIHSIDNRKQNIDRQAAFDILISPLDSRITTKSSTNIVGAAEVTDRQDAA